MSAKVFLDTNVVVYSFDANDPEKRERARAILGGGSWFVSWQVIQEFANVALHRFKVPLRPKDLQDYMGLVLWPRCRVFPSSAVIGMALEIHARFQYHLYDSLIVSSALAGGADVLYSEDLQDGQEIGALKIENPFRG